MRKHTIGLSAQGVNSNVPILQASGGAYDVVVEQSSVSLTFPSYTYDAGLTATVNSVYPATLGVQGTRAVLINIFIPIIQLFLYLPIQTLHIKLANILSKVFSQFYSVFRKHSSDCC